MGYLAAWHKILCEELNIMKDENLFNRPVVMVSGNTVKIYYTSINATLQDGFNPYKVALVCVHGQKTHKGKIFRFASEMDIVAYEILKNLTRRGGGKK